MRYLVSRSQLMNGEDLRWVKCLAEHIHSPKLTAENPIGIGRLRRAEETFIITLERRKGEVAQKREVGDKMDSVCLSGHRVCFLWSPLNLLYSCACSLLNISALD